MKPNDVNKNNENLVLERIDKMGNVKVAVVRFQKEDEARIRNLLLKVIYQIGVKRCTQCVDFNQQFQ